MKFILPERYPTIALVRLLFGPTSSQIRKTGEAARSEATHITIDRLEARIAALERELAEAEGLQRSLIEAVRSLKRENDRLRFEKERSST